MAEFDDQVAGAIGESPHVQNTMVSALRESSAFSELYRDRFDKVLDDPEMRKELIKALTEGEDFAAVFADRHEKLLKAQAEARPKWNTAAYWKRIPVLGTTVTAVLAVGAVLGIEFFTEDQLVGYAHAALGTENLISTRVVDPDSAISEKVRGVIFDEVTVRHRKTAQELSKFMGDEYKQPDTPVVIGMQEYLTATLVEPDKAPEIRKGIHGIMRERPVLISHGMQSFDLSPPEDRFGVACRQALEEFTAAGTKLDMERGQLEVQVGRETTEFGRATRPLLAQLELVKQKQTDLLDAQKARRAACLQELGPPKLTFTFYADLPRDEVRARLRIFVVDAENLHGYPTPANPDDIAPLTVKLASVSNGDETAHSITLRPRDHGLVEIESINYDDQSFGRSDKIHKLIVELDRAAIDETKVANYVIAAAFVVNG